MSVKIWLTEAELDYALVAAMARIKSTKGYSYENTHLDAQELLRLCALGAAAEIAAAKWLNALPFQLTIDTYKDEPDIWPNWEVKHSEYSGAHLIIKDSDRDTDRAVLVTGVNPFTIVGWLPVEYCKDDLYLKATRQTAISYWVPQSELVKVHDTISQT
jgi:hypothetical protein